MADVPVGSRILELGVGGEGGIIAALLGSSHVHGIDVSDSAIAACRGLGIPVNKANCDRESLPFDASSFDAVIALEVFEHFSNPQFVIEEIRRVLKPGGTLIISIPSRYTYHWPRLFYPDLFVPDTFHDFLLANRFLPKQHGDPFFSNCFNGHPSLSATEKSFSLYWQAAKISDLDLSSMHMAGKELFSRKDHNGIRVRPIEALELFKQCMDIAPASTDIKTDYLCALFYRVINGDSREFQELFGSLIQQFEAEATEHNKVQMARSLLTIHNEAEMLGRHFLEPAFIHTLSAITP